MVSNHTHPYVRDFDMWARSIDNVHERRIAAPAGVVGDALDRLGGPDDVLWPGDRWWPMILDQRLGVGADGGHSEIRYRVVDHAPGRRVRFEIHSVPGITGYHEFTVTEADDGVLLRHDLQCELTGVMRLVGPTFVEPLHDAVLEDLLDNAELTATGRVRRPARWSPWVRVLRLLDRSLPGRVWRPARNA